jgi:hypothetical protein
MTLSLYAWTTRLPDGSTSLVGTILDGLHTPLIAMRIDVAASLQPFAKLHAEASGQPVYLERYDLAERLDEIEGGRPPGPPR